MDNISIGSRMKKAWNAFMNRSPTTNYYGYSTTPMMKSYPILGGEKTIITSVCNRIAMDVADIKLRHVRLDDKKRFSGEIDSGLNDCLSLEANQDQISPVFIQDIAMTMLESGSVAVVPVETTKDPNETESYDILNMRCGTITQWHTDRVKVSLYNYSSGKREEIVVLKKYTAIIPNPLYSIMNESNSTMQRLIRKLSLLDVIDEQSGSGKLDLIIQLPYVIKTQARRDQAEERRKDIEMQLSGSKYGIAYTDGTEKITQLNRPVENNLMKQIEYLTDMLYSQLGLTKTILDGTADEKTMLNYMNRTVIPIANAIAMEMTRKFISRTARTQGQAVKYIVEPFKFVTVTSIAEIGDKMTRNEIMSSNEIRQIIGMNPSDDTSADELRNKNLNQPKETIENKKVEERSESDEPEV